MKRERQREFTLKQLENRDKTAWKVLKVAVVLLLVVAMITLFIIPTFFRDLVYILYPIFIWFMVFLVVVVMISFRVSEITRKCVNSKKAQIRVRTIKQLAKEHGGHIKAFANVKDEKIITDILSRSIEKIVIETIEGPNFVASIQLADDTWQSNVYISAEKLISLLDADSKKEILDHLIKYIKIGNIEGKVLHVTIGSLCFLYTNPQITDDELLEIFELKE